MEQTARAIQTLAQVFSKGALPPTAYVASLESLVRLALSEHRTAPVRAVQEGMRKLREIQEASRSAG